MALNVSSSPKPNAMMASIAPCPLKRTQSVHNGHFSNAQGNRKTVDPQPLKRCHSVVIVKQGQQTAPAAPPPVGFPTKQSLAHAKPKPPPVIAIPKPSVHKVHSLFVLFSEEDAKVFLPIIEKEIAKKHKVCILALGIVRVLIPQALASCTISLQDLGINIARTKWGPNYVLPPSEIDRIFQFIQTNSVTCSLSSVIQRDIWNKFQMMQKELSEKSVALFHANAAQGLTTVDAVTKTFN